MLSHNLFPTEPYPLESMVAHLADSCIISGRMPSLLLSVLSPYSPPATLQVRLSTHTLRKLPNLLHGHSLQLGAVQVGGHSLPNPSNRRIHSAVLQSEKQSQLFLRFNSLEFCCAPTGSCHCINMGKTVFILCASAFFKKRGEICFFSRPPFCSCRR